MKKYLILAISLGLISGCTNHHLEEYKDLCNIENSQKLQDINKIAMPSAVIIKVKSIYSKYYESDSVSAINDANIPFLKKFDTIIIPTDKVVNRIYFAHQKIQPAENDKFIQLTRRNIGECSGRNLMGEFTSGYYKKDKCFDLRTLKFSNVNDELVYEEKSNNPDGYPKYDQQNIYLNSKLITTTSIYRKRSPHQFVQINKSSISCQDYN